MLQAQKKLVVEQRSKTSTAPLQTTQVSPQRDLSGFKSFIAIYLVVLILALAVVAQHARVIMAGYELGRIESTATELLEQRRALEIERAKLGSLSLIEEIARSELGMREPEQDQVKVIAAQNQ